MAALYTNNASTILASGITNSATSLTVQTGNGAKFPNPTSPDYFMCTLQGVLGTPIEIIKVTARSTDTFTIVRAQEGTTASAFNANDIVELRVTAGEMTNLATAGANSNITSLTGLTTALSTAQGGTGVTTSTGSGNNVLSASPTFSGTTVIPTLSDGTNSTSSTNCIKGSAKAWAKFSSNTGAIVINSSFNVSSITYSSVGTFIVNFVTSMTDANYTFVGSAWSPAVAPGIMGMNGTATTSSCPVTNSTISSSPVVANYVLQSVAFIGN